jgi:hypothetical protein
MTAQATRSRPGRARAAWRGERLGGGDGMARRVRRQQLGAVLLAFGDGGRLVRLVIEGAALLMVWCTPSLLLHCCCCIVCVPVVVLLVLLALCCIASVLAC